MRRIPGLVNKACAIGAGTSVGLAALCGVGTAVMDFVDAPKEAALDSDIKNIAQSIDHHALAVNPEAMDAPVSSFPLDRSVIKDNNVTIKVAGSVKEGYCIIGTNSAISIESAETKEYSSRDSDGERLGTDTCDINTENVFTLIEGNPDTGGADWTNAVSIVLYSSFGLFSVSAATGLTVVVREEKHELHQAKQDSLAAGPPPVKSAETIIGSSSPDSEISVLESKINAIKAEWASYEIDLVKLLDYPAMTNMGVKPTAEFHKALNHVNYLFSAGYPQKEKNIKELRLAALTLEHKFNIMVHEAKRMRWNGYSEKERESLRTAQNLLAIAVNSASSMNERQIAYKRLIKAVEGILVFPEKARLELETKVSPAITISHVLGVTDESPSLVSK